MRTNPEALRTRRPERFARSAGAVPHGREGLSYGSVVLDAFKQMPSASIIIASHSKPQELAATLACLARQTIAADEVIVVDDASEPPLRALAGVTTLIRREGPRHLQAARNLGLRAAGGEVVLLLDDDCLVRGTSSNRACGGTCGTRDTWWPAA